METGKLAGAWLFSPPIARASVPFLRPYLILPYSTMKSFDSHLFHVGDISIGLIIYICFLACQQQSIARVYRIGNWNGWIASVHSVCGIVRRAGRREGKMCSTRGNIVVLFPTLTLISGTTSLLIQRVRGISTLPCLRMYQAPKFADFGRNAQDFNTDLQVYCSRDENFEGASI